MGAVTVICGMVVVQVGVLVDAMVSPGVGVL